MLPPFQFRFLFFSCLCPMRAAGWLWGSVGTTSLVFRLLASWYDKMLPTHFVHFLSLSWNQTFLQGSLTHFNEDVLVWTSNVHNPDLGCSLKLVLLMDRAGVLFVFLSEKIHYELTDISYSYLALYLNVTSFILKVCIFFLFLLKILVPNYIDVILFVLLIYVV